MARKASSTNTVIPTISTPITQPQVEKEEEVKPAQAEENKDTIEISSDNKKITIAEAVRIILEESPDTKPNEGIELLQSRFGIETSKANWSSTASLARKKLISGDEPSTGKTAARKSAGADFSMLFTVKELLEDKEPSDLLDQIEEVETLIRMAEQVGGLENLKACLIALDKLKE